MRSKDFKNHLQRLGSRGPCFRGKRDGPAIRDSALMARPKPINPRAKLISFVQPLRGGKGGSRKAELLHNRKGSGMVSIFIKRTNVKLPCRKEWRVKDHLGKGSIEPIAQQKGEENKKHSLPGVVIKESGSSFAQSKEQISVGKGKAKIDPIPHSDEDEEDNS